MNNGKPTLQKKRGNLIDDKMKLAVDEVRNKNVSVRDAADTFSVPLEADKSNCKKKEWRKLHATSVGSCGLQRMGWRKNQSGI
jgi:hypothetical protein